MNDNNDNNTRIKRPVNKRPENKRSDSDTDSTRIRPSVKNKNSQTDSTQFRSPTQRESVTSSPEEQIKRGSYSYSNVEKNAGYHGVLKGRFILAKIVGSGGMGVVYKAKDLLKVEAKDRDPFVAIKVLSEEFKSHPEAFISLQRESRKSQRIAHPNIVNVYDFDRDGDVVFMTMEYMDGRPLDKILRQYKSTGLPTDDAWDILKSICSALIHAHSENIIHSDFKPGNIFVTNAGVTKVFDFGIARAVAKVTKFEDNPEDRTVFDAGNLGALTPAYASMEMLEGQKPDARDDIYALGCIAYEIFTGKHPFNKVPADEAKRQGLVPERIRNITKRQWKAIKQALAFERKDRIASVEEFYESLTTIIKRSYAIPIILLFVGVIASAAYIQIESNNQQGLSESDIRSKVEFELQLDFHKKTLESLLNNPSFSPSWEDQIWDEFTILDKMLINVKQWLSDKDSEAIIGWLPGVKKTIYTLYLDKIRQSRQSYNFNLSKVLIQNATRYTNDFSLLDIEKQLLAEAVKQHTLDKNRKIVENQKISVANSKVQADKKKKVELFNIALNNVNDQLRCQSKLNMRNIDVAIKKLKSYNHLKYKQLQPKIITKLASCITELGKPFPEKAQEYKKYALRIFNQNKVIVAINIIPRDPCNTSIAGLGGRGKRTVCNDKFQGTEGSGPDLIVVVGTGNVDTFAIGKYEVSIKELNIFCKKIKSCTEIKAANQDLPATNVSFSVVKDYLKWLSQITHKKYRLPIKNEWLYAAKANRNSLDPNRNCFLKTRGIEKGEEMFAVNVGKPNSWGMVNYVGNASEWVYGKGRKLEAVGGSYNSPMESCNFNTKVASNGNADSYTGFRVLREMNK